MNNLAEVAAAEIRTSRILITQKERGPIMQAISFGNFPTEIVTQILNLTDVKGIRALLFLDKETLKIKETIIKHLNEVKLFYDSLIQLQQKYSSKQYESMFGLDDDADIMTNRVITGKVVQINPCKENLILEPALTEKQKKKVNETLTSFTAPQNLVRPKKYAKKLKYILEKDSEPKDLTLKPTLEKEYFNRMNDTSEEYVQPNSGYNQSKWVIVTIFAITKFTLTFTPSCTLSEKTKRKIIQSVDWANEFYLKTSQDKKKLESHIDVNTLEWGP